jgi:hypothetical protein
MAVGELQGVAKSFYKMADWTRVRNTMDRVQKKLEKTER